MKTTSNTKQNLLKNSCWKKTKQLLFASAIAVISQLNQGYSQITIDQSDMPNTGDTLRQSIGLVNQSILFKNTGTNYTWDFKSLVPISQKVDTFKAVSSTADVYNAVFGKPVNNPKANLANPQISPDSIGSIALSNIYNFYKKSSTLFTYPGLGATINGINTPIPYQSPDTIYKFPLTYNASKIVQDSCTAQFNLVIPGYAYVARTQKRVNSVDGYGKLSTPWKSNVDVIRVKSVLVISDTFYLSSQAIGYRINQPIKTEYKWLAKASSIPILTIISNGSGSTEIISSINYRDSVRVLNTTQKPIAGFTANVTNTNTQTPVNFTDTSLNSPSAWSWTITPGQSNIQFMNGTTSLSKNPVILFKNAGFYTIKLRVANAGGVDSVERINYINVTYTGPYTVDFISHRTSGTKDTIFNFTNLSTPNPGGSEWTIFPNNASFVNGSTKNTHSPQIKFNSAGSYSVKLVVYFVGTYKDSLTKTNYITITESKPKSRFSLNQNQGTTSTEFTTNESSDNNPEFFRWVILPNKANYTRGSGPFDRNISFTLGDTGWYTIKLIAGNIHGIDTTSDSNAQKIYISESSTGQKEASLENFTIHGNPFKNKIFISGNLPSAIKEISLSDLTGREIPILTNYSENQLEIQVDSGLGSRYCLLKIGTMQGIKYFKLLQDN